MNNDNAARRDDIAATVLQGLLANPERIDSMHNTIKAAVEIADGLISELDRTAPAPWESCGAI